MRHHNPWQFESSLAGSVWPPVGGHPAGAVLALLFQLEETQWLAAQSLETEQDRQLEVMVRHAWNTVAYYRQLWKGSHDPDAPWSRERFQRLPLLTRRDLQQGYEQLQSFSVLDSHGGSYEARSSGSTGTPVRVLKSGVGSLFWTALALRDHLWHERDLSGKLAVISHGASGESAAWSPATAGLVKTGPSVSLGVGADAGAQLDWLVRQKADDLLTYPSNAAQLARLSLERGVNLRLREVRTRGEALDADLRALCREAWGAKLVDVYSAEEVGYVALQCPRHEHYHVQSENVLVEVLDGAGRACAPGEAGRVVVTDLHNFAMPLVRYEIGDYAELGDACDCGRGLPVLRRILGRVRNTLITSSGKRYWPTFGGRGFLDIAPVRQHQFVQKTFDLVEARLVTDARLDTSQEDSLRQRVMSRLPAGIEVRIVYCTEIPRSASGKFEDFVSEVASA